jgi:hypothetical protein
MKQQLKEAAVFSAFDPKSMIVLPHLLGDGAKPMNRALSQTNRIRKSDWLPKSKVFKLLSSKKRRGKKV